MKRHIYIIAVAVCGFTACKNSATKDIDYHTKLEFDEKAVFTLDSVTANSSSSMMVYTQDSVEYLVYLNHQEPSILFYNTSLKEPAFKIRLQKDGPNGVTHVRGVYVHSLDSIFVLNPQLYRLSLVNRSGEVLNKYSLVPNEKFISRPSMSNVSMPVLYNNQEASLSGDTLNLVALPDMLPFKSSAYKEGKTNIWVNIKDKKFGYKNNYPALYSDDNYSFIASGVFRTAGADKNMVYSFAASDSLYTIKNNVAKGYYAGSRYFDRVAPIDSPPEQTAMNVYTSQAVVSPYYHFVLYDKYRQLYYRVAVHEASTKNDKGEMNAFFDKPFSVIILDKNLKIIGEQEFPGGKFNLLNFFVAKKGLYMSESFYRNADGNENELAFSIYKPK